MPKRFSAKEIIKSLEHLGFTIISQRGSHIKMRGIIHGKLQTAIIPNHKQVATSTLASILRQANITKQELEDALK
jgi:predicted RNA binding protein YcfA (HicA-like mRNA interferase family)